MKAAAAAAATAVVVARLGLRLAWWQYRYWW
jgi:hypothetical protein